MTDALEGYEAVQRAFGMYQHHLDTHLLSSVEYRVVLERRRMRAGWPKMRGWWSWGR